MSSKRILKDYTQCSDEPPEGVTVRLANDADLHTWHVTIAGPEGSPYAGGRFGVVVTLPVSFPFKPPVVRFSTRIYHPNITNDSQGAICLPMLKSEQWKPAFQMRAVLEAVRNLLVEPQPDDPLETRIADEYRNQRATFDEQARQYVERYAKGEPQFSAAS